MKMKPGKPNIFFSGALVLLLVFLPLLSSGGVMVERVIDGDTIVLEGGKKVR